MGRRTIRVLRALAAGVLFGCGLGLGAHNGWVIALVVGIPLIATAVVTAPRPDRITELTPWATARPGIARR